MSEEANEPVGYKQPPEASKFRKGQSGNPRGRPRNSHREIPYDAVLGQMVTIREDGRERRVTAAEAFLLQLTQKGLAGDSAAARASLEAVEAARLDADPCFDQSCNDWATHFAERLDLHNLIPEARLATASALHSAANHLDRGFYRRVPDGHLCIAQRNQGDIPMRSDNGSQVELGLVL